jgi:hypothetical protein
MGEAWRRNVRGPVCRQSREMVSVAFLKKYVTKRTPKITRLFRCMNLVRTN